MNAVILKFSNVEDALIASGQKLKNDLDRKKYDLAFLEQMKKNDKPLTISKDGLGCFQLSKEKEQVILAFIQGTLTEQISACELSIKEVVDRFQEVTL